MAARKVLFSFLVLLLAACGKSTPATAPTSPSTPSSTLTSTSSPTATPTPRDVPIYQNSFEEISDLAAAGITSANAEVSLNTDNFNYPGPGTALEIKGTLPGAQYSGLHVDFSIQQLTGESSLDLRNKTIYYSAFIPEDSAIDNISLSAGRNGQFVSIAGINAGEDYWKKGVWNNYRFVLKYAQNLEAGYDTLRISGQRSLSSGQDTPANFLLDDLKWIGIDANHITVDDTVDSLRKYAANQHFKFGLWADYRNLVGDVNDLTVNTPYVTFEDPWVAHLNVQEGSVNTIWNFSYAPEGVSDGLYTERPEDAELIRTYNFGTGNGMTTLGYGIDCMFSSVPQWLQDLDYPEEVRTVLLDQVEKDLQLTKGQNPIWILFNEFIQGPEYGENGLKYNVPSLIHANGQDYGPANYYMPWASSPTDSSLIEAAFIKAHEVDPGATLILNDANEEQIGLTRSDFLFRFASGLKAKGIPIDGVGFELHSVIDPEGTLRSYIPFTWPTQYAHEDMDTYLQKVDQNVKRYASAGLKVAFTEVDGYIKTADLDLSTPDGRAEYERRLEWQAKYYAGLLKIAIENDNVILYHTWGVTDRWPDAISPFNEEFGDMHLFDRNFNPKPAYYAMLELLKNP